MRHAHKVELLHNGFVLYQTYGEKDNKAAISKCMVKAKEYQDLCLNTSLDICVYARPITRRKGAYGNVLGPFKMTKHIIVDPLGVKADG